MKIEFRHFPLDISAFNASKVSQCKNDGNSDILESLYANQQKWVKGSSIQEANKNLQKFLKNEGFSINFDALLDVPENITSSIPDPRILFAEVSPITHLKDSTMLDLPQPFGPTIPVRPSSIKKLVLSANDLNPLSWIFLNSIY